jgi:poly(3-hydroxybutyrate) depolymerase
MLYHLHEMSRAALIPMRVFTGTQAMLLAGSHAPSGRRIASACNVFEDLTRRYPKPAFNLQTTVCDGEEVPVHETIVKRKPFAQLKHFVRETERPDDPRLLIIAPLSGHYATLLRGTVEALLGEHDVYITDWRDARMVPVMLWPFGRDDYIDYLIDFLDYLGPNTHVLAVCQPAVPALAATA